MATWTKEYIVFQLIVWASGTADTSSHTVKLQPITSTYPTNAVDCTHKGGGYYGPDSDLDDETHYDIYVDGTKKGRLLAQESVPDIGI